MTTPPIVPPIPRAITYRELEASLEAYFRKQVRLVLGGRPVKMAPTEKGCPDRLVLLPGGSIHLVELKTYDGRVSAAQQLWHQRAAELGVQVHVVVGREGIDRWIAEQARKADPVENQHGGNRRRK